MAEITSEHKSIPAGTVRAERRVAAIYQIADYLLREGLSGANLKAMAAALGTSDRMLLYYFHDKDDILTAALDCIIDRMMTALDNLGDHPRPFKVLLNDLWQATETAHLYNINLQRFNRLMFQLSAHAANDEAPYRRISTQLMEQFFNWIRDRLSVEEGEDVNAKAALLMVTLDGLNSLEAVGHRDMAEQALKAAMK